LHDQSKMSMGWEMVVAVARRLNYNRKFSWGAVNAARKVGAPPPPGCRRILPTESPAPRAGVVTPARSIRIRRCSLWGRASNWPPATLIMKRPSFLPWVFLLGFAIWGGRTGFCKATAMNRGRSKESPESAPPNLVSRAGNGPTGGHEAFGAPWFAFPTQRANPRKRPGSLASSKHRTGP